MDYISKSILATLLFYDISDFPLTAPEILQYLINPGRVSKLPVRGVGEIKLLDIKQELELLVKKGSIGEKNGFYFLAGRNELYEARITREKISIEKWRKALRKGWMFPVAPFIRGVWINGSLALNDTDKNSDYDVLVIAKFGRLYTARFFLSLVASLAGARRKRGQTSAPDKFCFNHYVTDATLAISSRSLYSAQVYGHLKPILGGELLGKFYEDNSWMYKYIFRVSHGEELIRRNLYHSPTLLLKRRILEWVLGGRIGNLVEKILRHWQQERIRKNPVTYEAGGRVVWNDGELEFHPRSYEAIAIQKYNWGLRRLGITPPEPEHDSGLLR